jgi:hypothetical protein
MPGAYAMKKRTVSAFLRVMMLRGLRLLVWLWLGLLWVVHFGHRDDGDKRDFP